MKRIFIIFFFFCFSTSIINAANAIPVPLNKWLDDRDGFYFVCKDSKAAGLNKTLYAPSQYYTKIKGDTLEFWYPTNWEFSVNFRVKKTNFLSKEVIIVGYSSNWGGRTKLQVIPSPKKGFVLKKKKEGGELVFHNCENIDLYSDEKLCERATYYDSPTKKLSWFRSDLPTVILAKRRSLSCGVMKSIATKPALFVAAKPNNQSTSAPSPNAVESDSSQTPSLTSKTSSIANSQNTARISGLALLKKQCQEIGFTPKTEPFGKCVLELKRREGGAVTLTSKQNQKIAEQTALAKRIEEANRESIRLQKDAQIMRRRAEQKLRNERANRQLGQALMQFGLGMAGAQQQNLNRQNNSNNASGHGLGMSSFLSGSYIDGVNRICNYAGAGGNKKKTIGAVQVCPMQY
jgi:hypothetical protein